MRPVPTEVQAEIYKRAQAGQAHRIIAHELGVGMATVSHYRDLPPPLIQTPDKKLPEAKSPVPPPMPSPGAAQSSGEPDLYKIPMSDLKRMLEGGQ